jgi:hypothetical protein
MPFCPHCGSSIEAGQVFCRSCGASIKGEVPVTPRSTRSPRAFSPAAPPLPRSALPVRVLGIIGIVVIIAAVAYFALSGSTHSAGTQNNTVAPQGSGILPFSSQCSAGMSLCRGKCVNLQTDSDNCGACGFSVPYGQICKNGRFSSSSGGNDSGVSSAPAGTTPAGSAIPSATTAAVQVSCPSGRSSCSGTCRDLLNDPENCGSCGNNCPSGQNCLNARCFLPTSAPAVNTSTPITEFIDSPCSHGEKLCGSSCVDLFSNKNNCGVCGRACGSQEICVNARCGPACTERGATLCDDKCVDLDTDMNNCGSCGTECKTFLPNAKGSLCADGKCVISQCKSDYGDCNEKISDGCEVNLRLDASNCGSCGEKCPSGQVCYNKKCSVPVTM